MNWTDVIMLICINGVHVKLLRMGPVNMAAWRSCNDFRNATYKKSVLFRIGLSVNPVCRCGQHKQNVNASVLHKPPQCFSKHNWLSDHVKILQNLGSISKFKTPKGWHRGSNVLGAGDHKYYAPPYKIQITTMIRRPGFIQPCSSLWWTLVRLLILAGT